jgi:hypothetical protein
MPKIATLTKRCEPASPSLLSLINDKNYTGNLSEVWPTVFIIDPHWLSCNHWVANREGVILHLVLHDQS